MYMLHLYRPAKSINCGAL